MYNIIIRACSESRRTRIIEHNFAENKEKFRRLGTRKSRNFDAVIGKICRKDVCEERLNRLLGYNNHVFER